MADGEGVAALSLDVLVKMTFEMVAGMLRRDGGIQPVVFMRSRDGSMGLVLVTGEAAESGQTVEVALREILRVADADMYAFYSEAWAAPTEWRDGARVMPQDNPRRVEVVQVIGAHGDQRHFAAWTIIRDGAGNVVDFGADIAADLARDAGVPVHTLGGLTDMLPPDPTATKH